MKNVKAVLFDMDGTLVPMDTERFAKAYMTALAKKLAPLGYEPQQFVKSVWRGSVAMVHNDGKRTNEEVFWESMKESLGDRIMSDMLAFDDFYKNEFCALRADVLFTPEAAKVIERLKKRGVTLVLASNPFFPEIAQTTRVGWAGIDSKVFARVTSYENSHYCKPDPAYYTEILEALGLDASECLMVGNDAREDAAALKAGIDVFLLTDCLLDPDGTGVEAYPHGGYKELNEYLTGLGL